MWTLPVSGRCSVIHAASMKRAALSVAFVAASSLSVAAFAQDEHSKHHTAPESQVMLQTPSSVAEEHRELHETLARAAGEGGELGNAAKELENALSPHFHREEEIATPPLSLLPKLSAGNATAEMRAVLPMTRALERVLPQMLQEQRVIRDALAKFRRSAEKANRADYVRFSDQLAAHARQEEEILYPAAILVGRYIDRTAPAH
jgi:hypothetical protein